MTDKINETNLENLDEVQQKNNAAFDDGGFADKFFADDSEYKDETVENIRDLGPLTDDEKIDPAEAKANKAAYRQKLLDTYKKIFEMETFEDDETGLIAKAHYSERTVKGKFSFMQSERHEYVYIYDVDKLDVDKFAEASHYSWENGIETIEPAKGYLSSFITVVILADEIEDDALFLINKHRMLKNLKRQKMGIVNQRICGVDFSTETSYCNKDSKELGAFLQKFFNVASK